jgi:hypothetical protein
MAQVEIGTPALAGYLVRITSVLHTERYCAEAIFFSFFFFVLLGMSVIRMGRARLIAMHLRAGWAGSTRSCGGRMYLDAQAPGVLRILWGRFLLVRSSAEVYEKDIVTLHMPRTLLLSTYYSTVIPPPPTAHVPYPLPCAFAVPLRRSCCFKHVSS